MDPDGAGSRAAWGVELVRLAHPFVPGVVLRAHQFSRQAVRFLRLAPPRPPRRSPAHGAGLPRQVAGDPELLEEPWSPLPTASLPRSSAPCPRVLRPLSSLRAVGPTGPEADLCPHCPCSSPRPRRIQNGPLRNQPVPSQKVSGTFLTDGFAFSGWATAARASPPDAGHQSALYRSTSVQRLRAPGRKGSAHPA